ncbi:hypothetical protein H0H93_004211 [Arthromyces matolae]|nr:hypothetical protein H0H93_004211 [Arthromyces matolae]
MPKDIRRPIRGHEPSVKLGTRNFAAQAASIEHIETGVAASASATEILQSMSSPNAQPVLRKKEKMQAKHQAFLQRVESSTASYSKSHARRLKRKAKEQIANGLGDMQSAIASLDQDLSLPPVIQHEINTEHTTDQRIHHARPGMIGEGKKAPLSRAQRKKALHLEQVRHPLILSNPDFASNPFKTIRTHAQNTLLKREIPEGK